MTGGHQPSDPRCDLSRAVEEPELSALADRLEVLREVCRTGALVGMSSVLPFDALDPVLGVGKGRDKFAEVARCVPTGVIEVEMRVHHDVDCFRLDTVAGELSDESQFALDVEDLGLLRAKLVADSRVHENRLPAQPDEQAA